MFLRNAVRTFVNRKTFPLVVLVLAVGAASAAAMTIKGGQSNNIIVGTPNADLITDGQGNDTVWGLGGGDTITVGSGNDVVDADGQCSAGLAPGTYVNPPGLPANDYCSHFQIVPDGHATITAGNGDDTIYGGGGSNTITAGCGDDFVFGGAVGGDTISAGAGKTCTADDQIMLGDTSIYTTGSTLTTGAGDDVIFSQNPNDVANTITCAKGNGTTVYANPADHITDCAHVTFIAPARDLAEPYVLHRAAWNRAHRAHKARRSRAHHRARTHKTNRRGHSKR